MRRFWLACSRPSVWVALALLATGLQSSSSPSSSASITSSDLLLGVAVLLAAAGLLRGRGAPAVRTVPAALFGVLGVASVVVALVAGDYPTSLIGGLRFLELFCLVPITLMAALRTKADAVVVVGSLLGLGLVEGLYGVYQAATGSGALIGAAGVRAVGTFGAYNIASLGDLSAMCLAVCLALGVVLRGAPRFWAFAGAVFFVLPLAFSLARSAWIAAAVAAVVVISRGRPVRFLVTVAVVGVVAAAALPAVSSSDTPLGERLNSVLEAGTTPDQSVIDRQALWHAAEQMAFDHPLAGIGPRAFPEHRDAYADLTLLGSSDIGIGSSFARVSLDSPHDLYLLVAAEDGLVVAGLFVITFLVLFVRGFVRAARRRSDASTAVALAGAGVLTYQLAAMVTGDLGGPSSIFVAVVMGLAGWAAADVDLLSARRSAPRPAQHVTEGLLVPVEEGASS